MEKKNWVTPLVLVVVVGTLSWGIAFHVARSGARASTPADSGCVASLQHQCPPLDWVSDYSQLAARHLKLEELKADPKSNLSDVKDLSDLIDGESMRLYKSMPQGYHYNETTRVWDMNAPSQAQQTAPPPTTPSQSAPASPSPAPAKKK